MIEEGLEFVRETLASKYVKPDEREVVKSAIKQHTTYEVIDKISVELVETHDKYWARLSNLNLDFLNIDEGEVRKHTAQNAEFFGILVTALPKYHPSRITRA